MRHLFSALLLTGASAASAATITFDSEPQGAHVCQKRGSAARCFGVTPVRLEVELADANDSARYFLKKIGYQTQTRMVSAADKHVSVALKRRDIFFDPGQQPTEELKRLQQSVNAAMEPLIYGAGRIGGIDAELVGKLRVNKDGPRTVLEVGMLVTNDERRQAIGAVRRQREGSDRETGLARAVLQGEGTLLLTAIAGALRDMPAIQDIALAVDYTRTSAAVTDEEVHFWHTHVTGSSVEYNRTGTVYKTTYLTQRLSVGMTTVQDTLDIGTVLCVAPVGLLHGSGAEPPDTSRVIRGSAVYLNENRRKEFRRIGEHRAE